MSTRGSVSIAATSNADAAVWRRSGAAVELRDAALQAAEAAELRRVERVGARRAHLGHVARRVDRVVERDEHAHAGGRGARGERDGVEQVHRPVGGQRRGRPHRAGHHDRLARAHGERQEVRGLLERVGAVRDHHAVDVVVGGELVDAPREREPVRAGQVPRQHLEQLLAAHLGHVAIDGTAAISASAPSDARA
jgi:hypothetical protein